MMANKKICLFPSFAYIHRHKSYGTMRVFCHPRYREVIGGLRAHEPLDSSALLLMQNRTVGVDKLPSTGTQTNKKLPLLCMAQFKLIHRAKLDKFYDFILGDR